MSSSILIASYLGKDTWKRWCEQPGSPLSRLFVTGLLAAVAALILATFQMLERSVRERLENFGLDTLLVRQTVTPDSAAFFRRGEGADPFALLAADGRELHLRQLFARGRTEWSENNLLVFSYPPATMPALAGMLSRETPVICLSDALPKNTLVRVQIGRRSLLASVARPQSWLHALSSDDVLLVPQGWLPDEEASGWLDTTIFQRAPTAPPMDKIIAAVNAVSAMDQRFPRQIQSALPLMKELDRLKNSELQWQAILAAILGGAVALVYGAIAVLEFRQNLFIGALLRSFGAPAAFLYFRHWVENILLANLAAAAAIFAVGCLYPAIFQTLGFADFSGPAGNPCASGAVISIFLWINAGAFLSSLPVAAGLRQPVGEILS